MEDSLVCVWLYGFAPGVIVGAALVVKAWERSSSDGVARSLTDWLRGGRRG